MPHSKFNIKSRKVASRSNRGKTRKAEKHVRYLEAKERKQQLLNAAFAVQQQVRDLRRAGVLRAPPHVAPAAAAAEEDILDAELHLDEALVVLHNAADQADDPAPLHAQIDIQAAAVPRDRCIRVFSVRALIQILMSLAAIYYSRFPIHAAPREVSMFDAIAGHLSTAGTLTGLASLPISGVLTNCAFSAKIIGKAVRNYNAATGRFGENTEENFARRRLNLLELAPGIGTGLTAARVVGTVPRIAFNAAVGKPFSVVNTAKKFTRSAANVAENTGGLIGMPAAKAMAKMESAGIGAASIIA
jgi:hypothetical protein